MAFPWTSRSWHRSGRSMEPTGLGVLASQKLSLLSHPPDTIRFVDDRNPMALMGCVCTPICCGGPVGC